MINDTPKPIFVIIVKEGERYSAESVLQAVAGITLRMYEKWMNTDIYITDPAKHPLNRWEQSGGFFTLKTAPAEQWEQLAMAQGLIHVSDEDTSAWTPGIFYEDQISTEIIDLDDLVEVHGENIFTGKEIFAEPMISVVMKKDSEAIGETLLDRADAIVRYIPRLYVTLDKFHRDLWAENGYVLHVFEEQDIKHIDNSNSHHMAVSDKNDDIVFAGYFIHTHAHA